MWNTGTIKSLLILLVYSLAMDTLTEQVGTWSVTQKFYPEIFR